MSDAELERLILGQITKPTARDQQSSIGPSQIGECPYCLGVELAKSLPEMYRVHDADDFGFTAWRGTAIHHYIEQTFDIPGALHEQRFEVFDLEGYGRISGSCDLLYPPYIVDWKAQGKYSYDLFKLYGPSTKYRVQQHLYAYGARKKDHPIDRVCIASLPQTSNNVQDIRFWYEDYNEALALAALDRLETIWEYVRDGELQALPSELKKTPVPGEKPQQPNDICYQCDRKGRIKVDLLQAA